MGAGRFRNWLRKTPCASRDGFDGAGLGHLIAMKTMSFLQNSLGYAKDGPAEKL